MQNSAATAETFTAPLSAPEQLAPAAVSSAKAQAPGLVVVEDEDRTEDPSLQLAEVMDRSMHYLLSRLTLGLSPMAMAAAYFDWTHPSPLRPASSCSFGTRACARARAWQRISLPARQQGSAAAMHFAAAAGQAVSAARRGRMAFQRHPSELPAAAAVVAQRRHRRARRDQAARTRARIRVRQMLDMFSPSNFLLTNPEVLEQTRARAARTWCADIGT